MTGCTLNSAPWNTSHTRSHLHSILLAMRPDIHNYMNCHDCRVIEVKMASWYPQCSPLVSCSLRSSYTQPNSYRLVVAYRSVLDHQLHFLWIHASDFPWHECKCLAMRLQHLLHSVRGTHLHDLEFLPGLIREGMSDIHGLSKCWIFRIFFPFLVVICR